MNGKNGYAVFFFPQALEALGEAIKPYLQDGPAGPHLVCQEIDTGGALIEMTLEGVTTEGRSVLLELMLPGSMVRMIVSSQSDGDFGFGPRLAASPASAPVLPSVRVTVYPFASCESVSLESALPWQFMPLQVNTSQRPSGR